jgi:long-chain fatty acid transport protein
LREVMRSLRTHQLLVLGIVVCMCRPALHAGGLDAPGISARSAGLGGATSALVGNPTFAYGNPASMAYLDGVQFSIGTTVGLPDYNFAPAASRMAATKMQSQVLFPPNLCLTYTFESGFGLGVGVTIPYSRKTGWGSDWIGRTAIVSSEVRGFVVSPMTSFNVSKSIAVGFGLDITSYRNARSARLAAISALDGSLLEGTESMLGSSDPAVGVHIGALYFPDDAVCFGLAYTSRCRVGIDEGTVTYEWPATPADPELTKESRFSTSIVLPDRIRAGVSLRPFRFLMFTGEVEYTRWSSIGTQLITVGSPATRVLVEQRGWKDVASLHAGAEIVVGDVALRGGLLIDRSPVTDAELRPSVPDADRVAFTGGLGYKVGEGLVLDFALQLIRYADRKVTSSTVLGADGQPLTGTYTMSGTVLGLTLSYLWN